MTMTLPFRIAGYGNEEAVGKAIRESGIPREKFFVTTKLKQVDHGRVAEAFEESLKLLNIDYIDLYISIDVSFCPFFVSCFTKL
jgi:diketogulonate reductase-like aldo/keto reductase